jgi:NAD(P)H-hydrate epimerase
MQLIDEKLIGTILRPRRIDAHKGDFGHALFIGGSYGKMGAAVLASRACLRAGVGLLSAYIPACGYLILQISVPEAMCMTDSETEYISAIPANVSDFSAVGVGPGIGRHYATEQALFALFDTVKKPLVIDADALNLIAKNKDLLACLPKNSILTPHAMEFERLSGVSRTDRQAQIEAAVRFSAEHQVYLVLKGAGTIIATPTGAVFRNTTGNPAMATAGSGDVLCGIILSLLAQAYSPQESAMAGVFLHGWAGDRAAKNRFTITAGDIVDELGVQVTKQEQTRLQNGYPIAKYSADDL